MKNNVKYLLVIISLIFIAIPVWNKLSSNPVLGKYTITQEKCIGCEACVKACPVQAIKMVAGKAIIDQEKCIECGICVNGNGDDYLKCPVNAINEKSDEELKSQAEAVTQTEVDSIYFVDKDGCIGCALCVSNCPTQAIEMVRGKAVIDQSKCIKCGICVDGNEDNFSGCPVDTIHLIPEIK